MAPPVVSLHDTVLNHPQLIASKVTPLEEFSKRQYAEEKEDLSFAKSQRAETGRPTKESLRQSLEDAQEMCSQELMEEEQGTKSTTNAEDNRPKLEITEDTNEQAETEDVVPPLPDLKPLPALRRLKSDPEETGRRSIFNQYWRREKTELCGLMESPSRGTKKSLDNSAAKPMSAPQPPRRMRSPSLGLPPTPPPLATRKRSVSLSSVPSSDSANELSFRDFAPPSRGRGSLLSRSRDYFRSVKEVPRSPELDKLPPLPVPLQRFYSVDSGQSRSLGGMYPVLESPPKPILRQSSYRRLDQESIAAMNSSTMEQDYNAALADVFNLTRTRRILDDGSSSSFDGDDKMSSDSTVSASSQGDRNQKRVCFDPRITVTEFEDDAKRPWFTDTDLERFRVETVLLAQKYLISHPEAFDTYNKPFLCPVTGTLRRKALYSMPALSADDEEDIDSELSRYQESMKHLASREIRNILLVDRNKLILDLFRRSLKLMFPFASIVTVQSSADALRLFEAAFSPENGAQAFDMVIAEERLHRPLTVCRTPVMKEGKSFSDLEGLTINEVREADNNVGVVRHGSLLDIAKVADKGTNFSGSELLKRIDELCEGLAPSSLEADTCSYSNFNVQKAPLLVGVSAHPEQDAQTFYKNRADVVWGKPPPTMDEHLRDQLVSVLVKKRRAPGDGKLSPGLKG